MPLQRSTQSEFNDRVEQLYELLLQGYSSSHVVKASQKLWGVSERTAWRYLEQAKERLQAPETESYLNELNSTIKKTHFIYNKALKKDDLKTALNAIKTGADILMQLKKEEKLNVTPLSENPSGSEELRKHLQSTRKKH